MSTPAPYQPNMWYDVQAKCPNTACPVYNQIFDAQVYSNSDANPVVICGRSGDTDTIISATLMNPQPPVE